MEDGLKALEEKQWGSALDCFRRAIRAHPGAENLRIIIETLQQIEDTRRDLNQAIFCNNEIKARDFQRSIDLQEAQILSRIKKGST